VNRLAAIGCALVCRVSVSVSVVGCGGSDSDSSDARGPRAVAVDWTKAIASHDGETACSLMTPASVRWVEQPLERIPGLPFGGARGSKADTGSSVEAMPQAHVPRNGSRAPGCFDNGSRRARSRTDEGELTDPSSCRAVLRRRGLACGLCPNLGPPLRNGLTPRAAVTRAWRRSGRRARRIGVAANGLKPA
jgi:hypothetical protein